MKLNISETEAFITSCVFSSLFVISVYIWKPIVTPPADIKQIWMKKWYRLSNAEKTMIEEYEIRMRMKSVGTLSILAFIFILCRANLAENQEVSMLRWFGLRINFQVIR